MWRLNNKSKKNNVRKWRLTVWEQMQQHWSSSFNLDWFFFQLYIWGLCPFVQKEQDKFRSQASNQAQVNNLFTIHWKQYFILFDLWSKCQSHVSRNLNKHFVECKSNGWYRIFYIKKSKNFQNTLTIGFN